jgi:hypothetical protein
MVRERFCVMNVTGGSDLRRYTVLRKCSMNEGGTGNYDRIPDVE